MCVTPWMTPSLRALREHSELDLERERQRACVRPGFRQPRSDAAGPKCKRDDVYEVIADFITHNETEAHG